MKRIIAVFIAVSIFVSTALASNNLSNFTKKNTYLEGHFFDVSSYAWYMQNVVKAYELGLLGGVSAREFAPEKNITDYETLALACRLHNIYYNVGFEFKQGSPWYQVYVDYAKSRAIPCKNLSGKAATRELFVTTVAAALPDAAFEEINEILLIPDVIDEKASYYDAVHKLYRAGVLTGSGDEGEFLPDTNIKRSEVAAIVTRIADTALRINFRLPKKSEEYAVIEEMYNKTNEAREVFSSGLEFVKYTLSSYDVEYLNVADDIFHKAVPLYEELLAMCDKYEYLAEIKPYYEYKLDFCKQFAYKETNVKKTIEMYNDYLWKIKGGSSATLDVNVIGGPIGKLTIELYKKLEELREEEAKMIKEKKNV